MSKVTAGLLLYYSSKYKFFWVAGVVLVMLANTMTLIQPILLGAAVDNLANQKANHDIILWFALGIIGLSILEGCFRFGFRFMNTQASRRVEYDIRADFFRKVQSQDQAYFQGIHTGDLMSRATNDLNQVRNFLGMGVGNFVQTIFTFTLAMILMFTLDAQMAIVVLVVLPLASLSFFLTGRAMQHRYEKVQAKFGDLSTHAQENFSGIRVIKAYAQEELEIKKFADQNREYIRHNLAYVQLSGLMWPLMFFIMGIATALVLWLGGQRVVNKELTLGQLVQFMSYIGLLSWPMIALGWVVNLFQQGMASMKRISEVLQTTPDIRTSEDPVVLEQLEGEIQYEHVSLKYGETWVLRDINFVVPAGSSCAIVGPTGAGKTTLVNMLSRVRDPDEGQVLVDNVDVRKLDLAKLRRQLGYVPQDTFLFSLPLAENIAFGVEENSYSLEDVYRAAEAARLSKDLEQIPGGLEAVIGERGVTLSGGQKQRTAIARAVMRDPAIMILDDALSSIDTQTQAEILANLRALMENRTTLIISQRISTVKDCDQILVLDNGQIIERGDHRSLLTHNGLYASMYRRELLSQELDES
ncbi:MAG TPA: ABC transporter ATP-binding protein [Chloroflexia bacterium]|nr:ABC transporter ATP-binding protein [Chloroflexia bacterium]